MTRNIIIMLTLLFPFVLWGQKTGTVTVDANPKIDQIMEAYAQLMSQNPGTDGFRILIFSDSGNRSKAAAIQEKENFEQKFPDIEAYIFFEEPNYKVRVGNFRTRLDAERCLNKISGAYSNTIIVPDYIEFPELAEEEEE